MRPVRAKGHKARSRKAGGRKASGGSQSGRVRGLHPGTREASPSGPIILLHHVMPKDGNLLPMRLQRLSQVASHNPEDNYKNLNRVSNMNYSVKLKNIFKITGKRTKIKKKQ